MNTNQPINLKQLKLTLISVATIVLMISSCQNSATPLPSTTLPSSLTTTAGSGLNQTNSGGSGNTSSTANPGGIDKPLDLPASNSNSLAVFLNQKGAGYVDANLGPTGKAIITPVAGAVGTWDIPVPLINPLGSRELYTEATYNERNSHSIEYISNYTEYKKTLNGEYWLLTVENGSGLPLAFIKDYAKSLGAEIFSNVYADDLVFRLMQDDAIWWCDAHEKDDGYEFAVIKQTLYSPGKEYTLSGDDLNTIGPSGVAFSTINNGGKFQTLHITLPSGQVRLKAVNSISSGASTAYCNYDIGLDSKIATSFILDSLPQIAGLYDWYVETNPETLPSAFTFKLEETYDLPIVKAGTDLGALLVKGVPFGSVFVQCQRFVEIDVRQANQQNRYGSENIQGSLTADGDTLFVLPAGLYTIINQAPYMNIGSVRTQLVPVSSGEQTVVTLPASLTTANARLNNMADESELTGGIELTDAKDLITTAETAISVSDPLDRDITPTKENTVVYEGSSKVQITDIRRVVGPYSVALVIDSSGSMKADMTGVLAAAKAFLETLPAGSFVKVIDFDSKVKVLNGDTPTEAIKALAGITADGKTKLYDATLKGVETVLGKDRPAVIVFTDGRDSVLDKSGGGSVNSKSAVIEQIRDSKIPVYTIGYGKRLNAEQVAGGVTLDGVPDIQCLLEFASAANGQYYPAKNPAALTEVFAAISSKLGNHFVITYNRPTEHNISGTPFVSLVVDNSGSMNSDPSEGIDCNYRMEKTIALFHDFFEKLPSDVMMQFTTFQTPPMSWPLIIQQQITTDQKANLLKALGEMDAYGGTPIIEALRTVYENIVSVPTSKKVIVLLTDGGLAVEEEQLEQYQTLLKKIKEKNISVLFIGMGSHSQAALFQAAAQTSGGDYVISEDVAEIRAKLDLLLNTLKETAPPDTIPITIAIQWEAADGEVLRYGLADDVKFSIPQKAGPPIVPDLVKTVTGEAFHRYEESAAAVIGLGIPGIDQVITSRVAYDKKSANQAMELTVKSATCLSLFQGVEATTSGKQFVALDIELENKTPEKIPYQIPSLFNHFYLGVDQAGLYPASPATWLTDRPLAPFGNPEIRVDPGQKTTGTLVFIVPDQAVSQLSLHFYDTDHGHIQLPLSGKMSDQWLQIDQLPTAASDTLSDTFSLQLIGQSLKPAIEQYPADELSLFRIIEAKFQSKVQALLNLEPKDRFWLKIDTKSGALMSKLSDATAALPLGFLGWTMLGPGSDNTVRMAFDIPNGLGKNKSSLAVDLATGSKELPITTGEPYGAPTPVTTIDGPGLKVIINQLVAAADGVPLLTNDGIKQNAFVNSVILDVTFTDLPGNEGTRIPTDFFSLVNKNYQPADAGATAGHIGLGGTTGSPKELISPDEFTQKLIFGLDPTFGVFENQSRRGLVIFPKPEGALGDWTLQSPYLEKMEVAISQGVFQSPELLGNKAPIVLNQEFEDALDKAVSASLERHLAFQSEASKPGTIGLNDHDGFQTVPMPSLSTYGLKLLGQISTEPQVIQLLQNLTCLPINRDTGYLLTYGYQPEAVVTQGWGEIGDVTNLALRLLSKLGYAPTVRALALTETGKKALFDFSGVNSDQTTPLGISYRTSTGAAKTLVIPFMMDLSELAGFVYNRQALAGEIQSVQKNAFIEISVRYEPGSADGTIPGTVDDIGGSLGGDEGDPSIEQLLILTTQLPLAELSTDALDLCFMPTSGIGTKKGYYALLSTPSGVITGQTVLDNTARILGVEIVISEISLVDKKLVHYSTLADGDSLDHFFQTIAINLPDLTEQAAAQMDETARKVHDGAKNPDPLSIAKWYGRNALYQLISGSSQFDQQMASQFGLVLGRIGLPRCMILTSHLDKSNQMHTSLDLLQPLNEVQAGSEEASNAYRLLAGFYLSDLEGKVLPGPNKVSYLDLWTQAPEGTTIQAIPVLENDRTELLTPMKEAKKYPRLLLAAVEANNNLIFAPTAPTVFMGQERWAWLEIDPDTYQVLSVFDTGLHAGMAEFKLSMIPNEDDTVKWLKGIWVGTNVSV